MLNKIFEDIDRLVMLQADFNTAKKEIDDNLAKKVSKSGDTMSGQLKFDKSGTGVIWKDDVNMDYGLVTESDGKRLIMQDWKRKKTLMSNDDSGFIVNADNLLKKSGDIMTGPLNFAAPLKGVSWLDGETKKADLIYNNSEIYFRGFNGAIEKYPWVYNISTDTFSVNAQTNLLKKTGDTMSGNLTMDNRMQIFFQGADGKRRASLAVDEKK